MPEAYHVFYSWQSDLPSGTNRGRIRASLRSAASAIEMEAAASSLRIEIDEATRDLPGSPNIPGAILSKIERAQIFVADISTINPDGPGGDRRVPNPNVMFELGFAVARLGWSRIILLLNQEYGGVDLAPFDIDRHRVAAYRVARDASSKDREKQGDSLTKLLTEAIGVIVRLNPPRGGADSRRDPAEVRRSQDADTLKRLLETLHLPTLDQQVREGPHSLPWEIFHFWEDFDFLVKSSLFHIHDEELLSRIHKLHEWWGRSLSHGAHYEMNRGGTACLFIEEPMAWTSAKQREWDAIAAELSQLGSARDDLLQHVRVHYLEIDVKHCSAMAWQRYRAFTARMDDVLEPPKDSTDGGA